MRLIDADKLKRILYNIANTMQDNGYSSYAGALGEAANIVDNQPTISAVPVVRCSECKKCRKRESKLGIHWCNQWDNVVRDTDFCSFGERKMDGGAEG